MTDRKLAVLSSFITVAAMLACAHPQPASTGLAQQSAGIHNLLTQAELHDAYDRTLYDTIRRLRPTFLRSRQVLTPSMTEPEPVHVFIDDGRVEGVESLKLISPTVVKEVRFLEPQDAIRFGTGHHGGLIVVTLLH